MAAAIEKKVGNGPVVVSAMKMHNYANDPFVVRKTQQATELIKKYGLPDRRKKK